MLAEMKQLRNMNTIKKQNTIPHHGLQGYAHEDYRVYQSHRCKRNPVQFDEEHRNYFGRGVAPKSQTPHAPSSQNNDDDYLIPILSHGGVKMRLSTSSTIEQPRNNDKNKLQQPPPTQHNAEETESLNLHILQPSSDLCITVTDFALDGAHLVR